MFQGKDNSLIQYCSTVLCNQVGSLLSMFFQVASLFYFLFLFILFLSLLMFKYSCLHFPPTVSSRPSHPHLPPSIPPLFGVVRVSFIHAP